ncbi:response regulator [Maricaulis sp.]|uniref:response regulator n=1 Tax=Maricaulis sp. TaxID=1486257 RepID=UPI00262720AF|nr:response regulator [Maricaulis sp.]
MTDFDRPSLLIADDKADFRTIVREVAEPEGWAVTECNNGAELMAALEVSDRPSCVVLDLVMPEMDGIETLMAFLGAESIPEIILVSGSDPVHLQTAEIILAERDVTLLATLRKPVPVRELRAALARSKLVAPAD